MWMLVVVIAGGMMIYTNTYPTFEECESAGRAMAVRLVKKHIGVAWDCTHTDFKKKPRRN